MASEKAQAKAAAEHNAAKPPKDKKPPDLGGRS